MTFKSDTLPDVPKAFELIKVGGFKPRTNDVFFTVTGRVVSENGQPVLNLDKMKSPAKFALLPSEGKDSEATFAQAKEFAAQNPSPLIEVEGQWQPHADPNDDKSLPALKVTKVKAAKAGHP